MGFLSVFFSPNRSSWSHSRYTGTISIFAEYSRRYSEWIWFRFLNHPLLPDICRDHCATYFRVGWKGLEGGLKLRSPSVLSCQWVGAKWRQILPATTWGDLPASGPTFLKLWKRKEMLLSKVLFHIIMVRIIQYYVHILTIILFLLDRKYCVFLFIQ